MKILYILAAFIISHSLTAQIPGQIISGNNQEIVGKESASIQSQEYENYPNPSQDITNKRVIYSFPMPDSKSNNPNTNIIIRSDSDLEPESIIPGLLAVEGSLSGVHTGKLALSDDKRTITFKPDLPFKYNETISVILSNGIRDNFKKDIGAVSFVFHTSLRQVISINKNFSEINDLTETEPKALNFNRNPIIEDMKPVEINFSVLPPDFPNYTIEQSAPSSGYLFVSNLMLISSADPRFLFILDKNGQPFYYQRIFGNGFDFKMQPGGLMTWFNDAYDCFYVMDSTFTVIDTIIGQNGVSANEHDIRFLPNGHILYLGYDIEDYDMSQVVPGGDSNSSLDVIDIQEIDQNKNVVFQWRSIDHFNVSDAAPDINLLGEGPIDNVHSNALEIDSDGNILLSSRNMDEITKIDRQTGNIIWRWGGKNNQFKFINDTIGFSHQHSIRRLDNGDFVIFDNGNLHYDVLPSRAVEYKLDETNKTAELVWQNLYDTNIYSTAMGYVQRLANGNNCIGWGVDDDGDPAVTEVDTANNTFYKMTLPGYNYSYRAYEYNLSKGYFSSFVPNLISPSDSAVLKSDTVNLNWSRNLFAQLFHLQVAEDSAFESLIIDDSTLTDTSYAITTLEPYHKYYWHVLSFNNTYSVGGFSGYTDTWSFDSDTLSGTSKDTTSYVNFANPDRKNQILNYPNPCSSSTLIEYYINTDSMVNITIFNELGFVIKELINTYQPAGNYEQKFYTGNLPSGIYYYTITAGTFSQTNKMIIDK